MNNDIDNQFPEMDDEQVEQICQALRLDYCSKETLEATIVHLANTNPNLQYRIISGIVRGLDMDPNMSKESIAETLREQLPDIFHGSTEDVIYTFRNAILNNMNSRPQQGGRRKRQSKKRKSNRKGQSKRLRTQRRTRRRYRR
jgi:hypothetical protein